MEEAARSRLLAGVHFPSDVARGLELGRKVGDQVVARAKNDGFDTGGIVPVPQGTCKWTGTNPVFPLAGSWKTWALPSASQFRPGPPPDCNSTTETAELTEVKNFSRTFDNNRFAFFWQAEPGPKIFADQANRKIFESRLDGNAPRVARIFAAASAANWDATIACWDAKYTYWAARPSHLDSAVPLLFSNPNHPSYPSAHGCNSGAVSRVYEYFFPDDADFFRARADQAGESRIWAGIHFRSDVVAGLALGRAVADLVVQRIREDGADQASLPSNTSALIAVSRFGSVR